MAESHPLNMESMLTASRQAQQEGRFDAMLEHAERASKLDANNLRARFRLLECLLYCGQVDRVIDDLAELESNTGSDHRLLCQVAEYYTHCVEHASALRCYRRAVELQPKNPEYLFALSAAEMAAGNLDAADEHLSNVIALNPHDYDAYRNRATLKKQTVENNHIAEIEALLTKGVKKPAGEAQLCYALAKEYEDLVDYEKAFEYLSRGADKRRSLMNYDVEGDVAAMERLRSVFDNDLMSKDPAGFEEASPIFVMGLPRSGTTLVDRILSSHSRVDSLGEINNFAYSLMHTIGQAGDKLSLIDLAADIDFAELGERYAESIGRYGKTGPLLIDKTPLNYLYVGLIKLALPNAHIIHIQRNPMDSCYGMYRTLFRAGYPFSYDFDDLGKYYVAYRQLMDHWHEVAPDAMLDVQYEQLVDNQEQISRGIIEYCGLEWESACLDFDKNASAVATASSAQVRRPIYRDALQRWRRYEKQLQPIINILKKAGIYE
jgi:tetratricopeptide (TPR) repeat protein